MGRKQKRKLKVKKETPDMNKRLKVDPDVIVIEEAKEDMRDENLREEEIPGPSNRYIPPPPIQGVDNNANPQEFPERRQAIIKNIRASLEEMEQDYNTISDLNNELFLDRHNRQRLKQEIDKLGRV